MPRIVTKEELLSAIDNEYHLLKKTISGLSAKQMQTPGVCGRWSTKDLLAHLVAWKLMFLGWYRRGLRGENFKTPADDLKWNQTPVLNERIYQQWKDEPLEKVLSEFETTYNEMVKLANSLPEEQLFQKYLYPWMGNILLARWIDAQTSMHYRWARILIRKWKNSQNVLISS
jgi:hypothetical protein